MTRASDRSERIGQVEQLLLASHTPLSQAEIARRCKVHRTTVGRMIQKLINRGVSVRYTADRLLFIERTAYVSLIHLRLHETLAAFLACRLLARYGDRPTTHILATLEKIGASLQGVMPALGQHIGITTRALQTRLPDGPGAHQKVLELLTDAWALGRKVRLWYRPLRASEAFEHIFAPYFLEPAALGYSTYLIGSAEPHGGLRARVLERIEHVELTDESFSIPADFDPNTLLSRDWGVWFDEQDRPTTVRLRFSGDHAIIRMSETSWHPSERTGRDSEGRLLWVARIDEPLDMLPWIRAWGAACEVIEPQELRDLLIGDLQRQVRMYGIFEAVRGEYRRRFDENEQ